MPSAIENPLELPCDVASVVTAFIAEVIDFAHRTSPAKWGLTDYQPDLRLNVGFAEVLTTSEDKLRLICDSTLASNAKLGRRGTIVPGKNGAPYYLSIPSSVLVEIPYYPLKTLPATLERLRPALFEAIRKSGRRGLGRGVRVGHSPDLVREIGRYVKRSLPQPEHVASTARLASNRDSADLFEGALQRTVSNRFERNPVARAECISHYGAHCQVCRFSFSTAFGKLGAGFIHVHHTSPISKAGGKYVIDPIRDLRPVCPNCHAMLHTQDPPLSIDELRLLRTNRKGDS